MSLSLPTPPPTGLCGNRHWIVLLGPRVMSINLYSNSTGKEISKQNLNLGWHCHFRRKILILWPAAFHPNMHQLRSLLLFSRVWNPGHLRAASRKIFGDGSNFGLCSNDLLQSQVHPSPPAHWVPLMAAAPK